MARSLPVENLLPQNVGSIINYTCGNLLKQPNEELLVAAQPDTDNYVRDSRSSCLAAPLRPHGQYSLSASSIV